MQNSISTPLYLISVTLTLAGATTIHIAYFRPIARESSAVLKWYWGFHLANLQRFWQCVSIQKKNYELYPPSAPFANTKVYVGLWDGADSPLVIWSSSLPHENLGEPPKVA